MAKATNDYLKKLAPAGSTVSVVVCERNKNSGTKKAKFLVHTEGKLVDITHQIAAALSLLGTKKYDEDLSRITTTDPDNVVTSTALALYEDHKALTPNRV